MNVSVWEYSSNYTYPWTHTGVFVDQRYTEAYLAFMPLLDRLLIGASILIILSLASILFIPKYAYFMMFFSSLVFGSVLFLIFADKSPAYFFVLLGIVSMFLDFREQYYRIGYYKRRII